MVLSLGSVGGALRHPRSTLNRWQKWFDPHNLASLEDRPSRPRTIRQRTWGDADVAAVLTLRTRYPRWGKAKLAGLLARQSLSVSVVSRILRYLRRRRLLVEPRPARATPRGRHARPHVQRKPKGVPIPKETPGDLMEIDTMRLSPVPGVVRYHFYGVVGVRGAVKECLAVVRARCPLAIRAIQIDGSEFMAKFAAECQAREIPLWVLSPHSPKLNGQVERMDRTFREAWWEWYEGETDLPNMQHAGRDGEAVYNAVRPHQSLRMRTPVEFLADRFSTHP